MNKGWGYIFYPDLLNLFIVYLHLVVRKERLVIDNPAHYDIALIKLDRKVIYSLIFIKPVLLCVICTCKYPVVLHLQPVEFSSPAAVALAEY